jgi:hypothetical protein
VAVVAVVAIQAYTVDQLPSQLLPVAAVVVVDAVHQHISVARAVRAVAHPALRA